MSPINLNFGTVNVGAGYMTKYLQLYNKGADTCPFTIDFGHNPLDILACPKSGTLIPFGSVSVKLDLAAFTPGEHTTQFW